MGQRASEVCMQEGIHPHYSGETYLESVRTVKEAVNDIHFARFFHLLRFGRSGYE